MKKIYQLLWACLATTTVMAQPTVNITDASLAAGQTYNWTNDNVYLLDGLVFLEDGATLNIEEGTVVKFTQPSTGTSALVICRGAKIYAIGTPDEPIIFTSDLDDVTDPTDLGPSDVQLWAGLVILGKATTEKNGVYEPSIEGIPSTEPRGLYGAPGNVQSAFDDNDNSGTLKYVSIRHTGFGLAVGSELQGLTLGGVGRGTSLSYVDVYASSDDGVELFGGTVDLKYFSIAFAEDDSYDFDEIWKGRAQFLFSIQRADVADAGWEYDGSTPDDAPGHTNGTIYNFTHIGSGPTGTASNAIGQLIRAGGVVTARNGIISEMKNKGIEIQDKAANTTTDSYSRFQAGNIKIENNIYYNIGTFTTLDGAATGIVRITASADDATAAAFSTHLAATNVIANPGFASVDRGQNQMLNPLPSASGPAFTSLAAYPADTFFTEVDFKGAFPADASHCYIGKWSSLALNNHLASTLDWTDTSFTGINSYNDVLHSLNIYPNPASESVNISLTANSDVTIEIFDITGTLVKGLIRAPKGYSIQTINVSDLNSGFYFVRFNDGSSQYSSKLVVR